MNIDKEIEFDKFLSNTVYYVVSNKEEEILLVRYLKEKCINYKKTNDTQNIDYNKYCVIFGYGRFDNFYFTYSFDKHYKFSIPVINPSNILKSYYNNQPKEKLLNWINL